MDSNQYQNDYRQPVNQSNSIPDAYRPISTWGYFGYQLLFGIPCVGLILLIVFAVGGTKNVNLRNFARSYFCWLVIALIVAVISIVFFGGLAGLGAAMSSY